MHETALTDAERGVLAGLVRVAIRKVERCQATGRAKFGSAYDPTATQERLAILESAYRKLGGDPDRIARRADAPAYPPAPG